MAKTDSTRPVWPFPAITTMTPHSQKQWCKKIKGKVRYFGEWSIPDPDHTKARAALSRFYEYMKQLEATPGLAQVPQKKTDAQNLTVGGVVNGFVTNRLAKLKDGNLSHRQFVEYRTIGNLMIDLFGEDRPIIELTPADLALLRSRLPGGPVRVGNEVVWCRSILNWAAKNYGVSIRYGSEFEKPPRRSMRQATKAKRVFLPAEIKALLHHAQGPIKAMILLGINGGYGQTDCATLPSNIKLDSGVLDYLRHKTGVRRVVPLWPETIQALKEYERPSDAHPELFFVTRWKNPWVHEQVYNDEDGLAESVTRCDAVDVEFDKVQKAAELDIRGFYLLRHTFRTIADETCDTNAIRCIMGHAFPGMDEFYLHMHGTNADRIKRVTEHVRQWLFGTPGKSAKRRGAKRASGGRTKLGAKA